MSADLVATLVLLPKPSPARMLAHRAGRVKGKRAEQKQRIPARQVADAARATESVERGKAQAFGSIRPPEGPPPLRIREPGVAGSHDRAACARGAAMRGQGAGSGFGVRLRGCSAVPAAMKCAGACTSARRTARTRPRTSRLKPRSSCSRRVPPRRPSLGAP